MLWHCRNVRHWVREVMWCFCMSCSQVGHEASQWSRLLEACATFTIATTCIDQGCSVKGSLFLHPVQKLYQLIISTYLRSSFGGLGSLFCLLFVCLCVCLPAWLTICLPACLFVCLLACLSARPPACLSPSLPACQFVCLFVYLPKSWPVFPN